MLDAGAVALLGSVKQQLDGPVRRAVLQNGGHGLQNHAEAGDIVRAKDGRSVGGDASVRVQDGLFSARGRDRVHVRRQQNGCKRLAARQICVKIPGAAANYSARAVLFQRNAERGISLPQALAQRPLVERGVIDRSQLQKGLHKPFCPNHRIIPL